MADTNIAEIGLAAESITMSEDAIVYPHSKCDHCLVSGHSHEYSPIDSKTVDGSDGSDESNGSEDKKEDTKVGYTSYLASALTGIAVAIGCIACHHIACPVVTLKAGAVGSKLAVAKFATAKSSLHHFFARSTGGQCCCCSCGGCNGCCPCGTACCSCSC